MQAHAPPLEALAQFLGEAPSAAALARPPAAAAAQRVRCRAQQERSSNDSSDDDNEVPRYDGGFDDAGDYDAVAPFSAPQPRHIREVDEPRGFDCRQKHVPVSEIAAKRLAPSSSSSPSTTASSTEGRTARKSPQQSSVGGAAGVTGNEGSNQRRSGKTRTSTSMHDAMSLAQAESSRGVSDSGIRKAKARPSLNETLTPEPGGYSSFVCRQSPKSAITLDPLLGSGSSSRRRFGGRA
jgi:hypothetical protein